MVMFLLSGCTFLPMSKSSFMSTLQDPDNTYNTTFEHMLVKKEIKAFSVSEWLHNPEALRAAYRSVHEHENFQMTAEEKSRYEKAETEIFAIMANTNIIEKCFYGSALPPYGVANVNHACIDNYGYPDSWTLPGNPGYYESERIIPWKWKNKIPFKQKVNNLTESPDHETVIRDLDEKNQSRYLEMIRSYTVGDWISEYPTNVLVDTINLARRGKIHIASDDLKHSERMADAMILLITTSIKLDCWQVESVVEKNGAGYIQSKFDIDMPYPECLEFYGYPMSKRRIEQLKKQNALPANPTKNSTNYVESTTSSNVQKEIEEIKKDSARIIQKRQEEHESFLCTLKMNRDTLDCKGKNGK
jgi:hypothetical protein